MWNMLVPLDPTAFADAVVQIYQDNAGDLELTAKSIESSDLDFLSYGPTFFRIILSGGRNEPGTTKPDEGKRHTYSVIDCEPRREAILPSVLFIQKILRRRSFLIEDLEIVMQEFVKSLKLFEENERKKLAIFTALAFSQKLGLRPERVLHPSELEKLVAEGLMLTFITDFFKEFLIDNTLDDLITLLKWGEMEKTLMSFFPRAKRTHEFFSEHFTKEGLVPLVEYNKKLFELRLEREKAYLTTYIAETTDISETESNHNVCNYWWYRVKCAKIPDSVFLGFSWDALMDAVQPRKYQQQYTNAVLRQVEEWNLFLKMFCFNGKLELELMYKVQTRCYDDMKLFNLFPEIVRSLYDHDVLHKDTILFWFREGTNLNARQHFVRVLERFVTSLEERKKTKKSP